MKRQKTLTIMAVIVFVLCAIGLFAIAGCKTDESDEHEHTFMRVWSSDAEGHWHKATCEHTEEKGDYAPHVDVEQPYDVCDVCGYKMEHKHRYEENWSYDAENHWHNSTCNDVADDGREAHAWGRAVFVEPTCEEDGYNLYTCSVCGATKTEPTPNSPALGHAIGAEIVPDVPATCSEEGVKAHYECSVCHEIFKKTDDVDDNGNPVYEKMTHEEYAIEIDEDAHEWDNGRETTPATCTTVGVMTYTCINNPDHTKTGEIPMTPHEWNADGECIHCHAYRPYRILPDEEQTNSNFTLLEMGRYPQSQEKDTEKLAELNEKYPETPTDSNANGWTSYKYYDDFTGSNTDFQCNNNKDYMWYKDVDLDEDGTYDYRGVYISKYLKLHPFHGVIYEHADSGYFTNEVYWFKYEPIRWRMLQREDGAPVSEDGRKAILVTDSIIDASRFDHVKVTGQYIDYEHTDIRKFLTEDFYNAAFSNYEKDNILQEIEITRHDIGNTKYYDKISLLTQDEIVKTYKIGINPSDGTGAWRTPEKIIDSYKSSGSDGFEVTEEDLLRQLFKVTDYAKIQGAEAKDFQIQKGYDKVTYSGYGSYYTRYNTEKFFVMVGGAGGGAIKPTHDPAEYNVYGVLPVMWIKFN